jgi:hypothetical protein
MNINLDLNMGIFVVVVFLCLVAISYWFIEMMNN